MNMEGSNWDEIRMSILNAALLEKRVFSTPYVHERSNCPNADEERVSKDEI